MYKHIIWDFDGTLVDTYTNSVECFRKMLSDIGIDEESDEIMKYMKIMMTDAFNYYGKKHNLREDFFSKYDQYRYETELLNCRAFDGAVEICKYIYDSNRKNYLYTHRGESANELMKKLGLYDYFTDFYTSKKGFPLKPSPEAILDILKTHSIKSEEAIMIGDREIDILAGKNAGIDSCYFDIDGKISGNSTYSVDNFKDLWKII